MLHMISSPRVQRNVLRINRNQWEPDEDSNKLTGLGGEGLPDTAEAAQG